jgi:hypothetical protein
MLTSEISFSKKKIRLASSCDGAFAGAVADAPPVMAKDAPAAPNAKAAVLAVRLVARLALAMWSSAFKLPRNHSPLCRATNQPERV